MSTVLYVYVSLSYKSLSSHRIKPNTQMLDFSCEVKMCKADNDAGCAVVSMLYVYAGIIGVRQALSVCLSPSLSLSLSLSLSVCLSHTLTQLLVQSQS